ncbi:MAG TPA: GNAT family N-acetyltransferase [Candidatus Angelobacter sp.]
MPDPEKLEQLKSCNEPAFREFYEIYAASIAAREQKSEAWICEMVRKPDNKVLVIKRGGQVKGFSILFLPRSRSFGLLEYMAVVREERNRGLGAEIFRRSMEHAWTREGQAVPILLEVDSDREPSLDQKLRTRRQQFYHRLGCLRIAGLDYILPLPGEGPPPEMDLMIYPAGNLRQIPKADLEKWLETIYQDVYRCSPDDPRIGKMLANLPEAVQLE